MNSAYDSFHSMKGRLCGSDSEQNTPCDYCGLKKPCRMFEPNSEYRRPFFDVCTTCRKKYIEQEGEL